MTFFKIIYLTILLLAPQLQAARSCEDLMVFSMGLANPRSPLLEKTEIRKTIDTIRSKSASAMEIATEVEALKLKIEEAFKNIQVLEKEIKYLLKDRNYTSAVPSRILAASAKHKNLIEKININIKNLEDLNIRLNELKVLVAQIESYVRDKKGETTLQEADLSELKKLKMRIKSNFRTSENETKIVLDISEIEVRSILGEILKLFNQIEALTALPHKFEDLKISISAFQNKMEYGTSLLILNYKNHGRTDSDLNIYKTSERSLFERIPEEAELVVIEGLFSARLERVYKDGQNIRGKKYALIDTMLILDGIKHGDIYSDGTTTYGVVGFIDGKIMLQFIETKSKMLPASVFREFRSIDTKSLTRKYKKLGYNSYNRPLVAGDVVFNNLTGKLIMVEYIDKLNQPDSRKQLALINWDAKDIDGSIEYGTTFKNESRVFNNKNQLDVSNIIWTVLGVFPNGTFWVSEVKIEYAQNESNNHYSSNPKQVFKLMDYETLTQATLVDPITIDINLRSVLMKKDGPKISTYMIVGNCLDGRVIVGHVQDHRRMFGKIQISRHDLRKESPRILTLDELKTDYNLMEPTPQ